MLLWMLDGNVCWRCWAEHVAACPSSVPWPWHPAGRGPVPPRARRNHQHVGTWAFSRMNNTSAASSSQQPHHEWIMDKYKPSESWTVAWRVLQFWHWHCDNYSIFRQDNLLHVGIKGNLAICLHIKPPVSEYNTATDKHPNMRRIQIVYKPVYKWHILWILCNVYSSQYW